MTAVRDLCAKTSRNHPKRAESADREVLLVQALHGLPHEPGRPENHGVDSSILSLAIRNFRHLH